MPPTAENDFFRKKHTSTIAYLAGILLFFLPFVQVRCNDVPFAENTGVGLAFGTNYKVTDQMKSLEGLGNKDASSHTTREEGKLYGWALAAFLLGVTGLILSFRGQPSGAAIRMVTGLLAALCLIIVMIQIHHDVKAEMNSTDGEVRVAPAVKVTVDYTLWFYLTVCSFLAAAFFSYKHLQFQQGKSLSSSTTGSSVEGRTS